MLAAVARALVRRSFGLVLGVVLGSAVAACEGPTDVPAPGPVPAERPPGPVPAERPPGNPLSELAPVEAEDAVFGGVVAESIAAGGYTYLRVATDDGDRWVATMGKGAPVGHRVHVKNMGTRHDFHSRRLGRRFDVLAFGIVREA